MRKHRGLIGAALVLSSVGIAVLTPGLASNATQDTAQAAAGEYSNPVKRIGGPTRKR